MGRQLQAAGQFDKAEECYRRYLEDHEDAFKAHNNLGIVLEEQGNLGEAVKCYKTACELVPDDPIPLYNLGHAFFGQERFETAAGVFERVIEMAPDHGPAHLNLAAIHWQNQDVAATEPLLRRAIELPDVAESALHKLGLLLFEDGRYNDALHYQKTALALAERPQHYFHVAMCHRVMDQQQEAADALAHVVRLDPAARIAHEHRVRALIALGDREAAKDALDEWSAAAPIDPVCDHMRAAFDENEERSRCTPEYVRETFGEFATDYEHTLERLGYRAPEVIALCAEASLPVTGSFTRVLDAGCGTGLCAPTLRPLAQTLIGVDLAEPMLKQARARQLYDELEEADLIDYLTLDSTRSEPFDAVIAGDTFNYFGELATLFAATAGAMNPDGRLIFTLETGADDERDFQLMLHGRYAHAKSYVAKTLSAAGFVDTAFEPFVLRKESGRDVNAWLVTSKRV
ncbi:MAG: tetratricopeptide repeat protein [Gammaproteobacteria bacterium]